ncbi:MAG: hypothetical protein ACI9K9_001014, partial [Neolewinella sp.]
ALIALENSWQKVADFFKASNRRTHVPFMTFFASRR